MTMLGLRYDLRLSTTDDSAGMVETALEQIEWAERLGFASVALSEHHGTDDGYLPSPLLFGSAVAARTESIFITIAALVVPLHDPLRLAEDLAVLDNLSRGRLVVIVGAGYVPSEFEMFDKPLDGRIASVEETVEVLRKAWTGEPFEYRGRTVRVTPRPHNDGGPMLLMGGASRAAAERAARLGDGFVPIDGTWWEHYRHARIDSGHPDPGPGAPMPPRFLYVAEDPDAAWEKIAPYCLRETNAYARWAAESGSPNGYDPAADADELRASGRYPVLTPAQTIELAQKSSTLVLHPLCGGMDPELSWESLRLIEHEVLPALRD